MLDEVLLLLFNGLKLFAAAHDILGRCACKEKVKFIKANITDFHVLKKRPACDKMEL